MLNQKNTFISLVEQVALLNKNAVEIITSLNDVVTDRDSSVAVNIVNEDGSATTYYLPTVGQLKSEIDLANSNIDRLAGLVDNNVYISDGTTTRKIYVDDLNREPEPINDLNKVTDFVSINNSFFESLLNPLLAINIDLTDKIDRKVSKILSRRYIIKFLEDNDGNLTENGEISKKDFEEKFLNKNDIFIDDLTSWYNNPDNLGLLKSNEPYDEQVFSLDYDKLKYYGVFDVLGVDNDAINKKMWYVLGSLTYYDVDNNPKQLTIKDQLIINKKNSATKWIVNEISTAKSNYRVVLEQVEGLDPVPILNKGLKIYSPEVSNKSIKISIGFDEYNVIFIKPINTDSNIVSSTWSYGTAFFTNSLVLDDNRKISMNKYYSETVFDYGAILKDMVVKNIPSKYGKVPNVVELDNLNFKVIQINKHLTENKGIEKVKDVYAQKASVKSQIEQLNSAIVSKTMEINTIKYQSKGDKEAANKELQSLIIKQDSLTKLYYSLVRQISTVSDVKESPKYRVRGFWSFPDSVITGVEGYQKEQEVIQFEIQYRYSSKTGNEPTTEGYNLNLTEVTYTQTRTTTATSNQDVINFTNPDTLRSSKNVTGYFSNWVSITSDARKRIYNKTLDVWYWEIEDVSDADTPNINQLDIPIQPGERVEVKIKSISEVGYPNAPLKSDWSNILVIEFPDDLSDVGNEDDLILKESQNEELFAQLESKFNAKGLTTHLQQSFWNNDEYIAHMDRNLGTTFKNSDGNMIVLYDYLKLLTDKIEVLEEQISKAKGELVVKLFKNNNETLIANGASVNVSVICEDYAPLVSGGTRTYKNYINVIQDYYLQFENVAKSSQLGLLSYRTYYPSVTGDNRFYNPTYSHGALATYVDSYDLLHAQVDNQFIYISDTSGRYNIYDSGTTSAGVMRFGGVLESNYNIGLSGFTQITDGKYADPINIFNDVVWTGATDLLCTVHPYFENIDDFVYSDIGGVKLIGASASLIVPINIYFQLSGGSVDSVPTVTVPTNITTSVSQIKKFRIFLEPNNMSRAFEFEIVFKVHRNRTYSRVSSYNIEIGGDTGTS